MKSRHHRRPRHQASLIPSVSLLAITLLPLATAATADSSAAAATDSSSSSTIPNQQEFSFDHAFRKFEDFLESRSDQIALEAREAPQGLVVKAPVMERRMGTAAAADNKESRKAEEGSFDELEDLDEFLRKVSDHDLLNQ